ncbi:ATP-dependent Clp protease adaptor ClpS [Pontibacter sp. BAB1700]|uniref:ATP-dependent Clp protease adaptor ClpS n=1 Tax=Pontibacter sp. BAB1700 TaxID=1144253 RepID=UPI00026BC21A|nr:ATP-dependent Clp protease adaptor ClpS [Pontibacter sp. BAB1700]EJF08052.1 ATP-dependent Clp protease adaptor protein ClpS [Pontibacter sp. BAB1700]
MNIETEILHQDEVALLEESTDLHNLIVYNDDVNTFDHVIATLIKVCGHSAEQAEQCTLLIHYKGKCTVKVGSYEELAGMCTAFTTKTCRPTSSSGRLNGISV